MHQLCFILQKVIARRDYNINDAVFDPVNVNDSSIILYSKFTFVICINCATELS
jgi:hypothetical protein